jgi:crotonobetainyl-CoA:carnitine CoA-transferase CaiB-like acyl-CoA transferase
MAKIVELSDGASVPYAPIARPDQLFDDPQLNEGGALAETTLPSGARTKLPKLPLRMGELDFGLRRDPPGVGEHSREVLEASGFSPEEIERFVAEGIVASSGPL